MKLHWSPRSPFVRKVCVVAIEQGLTERVKFERTVAIATAPGDELLKDNPLHKIPTLVLDDGSALFDSRVICEYLDALGSGPRLFPGGEGPEKWAVLRQHALADGLADLLILWRQERSRALDELSESYRKAYAVKAAATLAHLEKNVSTLAALNIGSIATGCALGYLDFRFDDMNWRKSAPALADWFADFSKRKSMRETEVEDDLERR